jgi:hypothetical protein
MILVGGEADKFGKPYDMIDLWQTKFNATVLIE